MSQYTLADRLAAVSGRPTMGRDRVARWERGRQVPRREWRQWLAVVLHVPAERLDDGAAAARRQNRVGRAAVTTRPPTGQVPRRQQGTPALLPVFRSRVQAGILAATLLNPDRAFSLTELADHAGGSLASVSKEAKLLEDAGILTRRSEGAIRLIRAATDKPTLRPLTELIRVTYGVPQIVGEEFGRVTGVTRIALTGTWAERFAGVVGPEPRSIQVRLMTDLGRSPDHDDLVTAAHRAERRLGRAVVFTVAAAAPIPRQRGGPPVVQVAPPDAAHQAPSAGTSWPTGHEAVRRMIADRRLELFSGSAVDGRPHFDQASRYLDVAGEVTPRSIGSAYILLCQAAQQIARGLLAAQGLRPAAGADGEVLGECVVAQFGPQFGHVGLLRHRQTTLDHPGGRDNRIGQQEVDGAVPALRDLLRTARDLAPGLDLFA